jgi:signal transduction histidine kinase/CheY-like chemotaxis protein
LVGAILVVVGISFWVNQSRGHTASQRQVQALGSDLERAEVLVDGLLTAGDFLFFGHTPTTTEHQDLNLGADYFQPATSRQCEQLVALVTNIDHSTHKIPFTLNVGPLLIVVEQMERVVAKSQTGRSSQELNRHGQLYETVSSTLVAEIVAVQAQFAQGRAQNETAVKSAEASNISVGVAAGVAYVLGLLVLWRYANESLVRPLVTISQSARSARSGHGAYLHQRVAVREVVELSKQLELLIDHLEMQVKTRTTQLSEQTEELRRETKERTTAQETLARRNTDLEVAMVDLGEAQRALIHKARLQTLGQMSAGLSHDFNNLLMPILAAAEALQESLSPEEHQDYVETIMLAAKDAATLVSDMRTIYKGRTDVKLESVNVAELLDEVIGLARKSPTDASTRHVPISIGDNIPPGLTAWANKVHLRQCLVNLIQNARHACVDGGTVLLRACKRFDGLSIEVCDTGTGMTPEVLQRCKEPMFTTKADRGLGLGLANVVDIVGRYGGSVKITSTPGGGTSVNLHLLKSTGFQRSQSPAIERKFTPRTERPGEQKCALVIDDDHLVLRFVTRMVERAGFSVVSTTDPLLVAEMVVAHSPQLILTDHNMPGMLGVELIENLRASGLDIPAILMTGFVSEQTRDTAERLSVEVLNKPLSFEDVRDALLRAVAS